jgi:hypothetical protein
MLKLESQVPVGKWRLSVGSAHFTWLAGISDDEITGVSPGENLGYGDVEAG